MKLTVQDKVRIMRSLAEALQERVDVTIALQEGEKDPNRTDIIGLAQRFNGAFGVHDRAIFDRFFNMSLADLCKESKIDLGKFRSRKKLPKAK